MDSANEGSDALHGGAFTVTSSTTQLIDRIDSLQRGVTIRSAKTNTSTVYVGGFVGVDTSSGFPIYPGESVFIPTRSPIWGITDGADADCRYLVEAA